MNRDLILERFALIADMTIDEATKWYDICDEAGTEIEIKIKSNVNVKDQEKRLVALAAVLAYYKYVMYTNNFSSEGFSVGEISVKNSNSSNTDAAKTMWENQKNLACDLLIDDEFNFRQVR